MLRVLPSEYTFLQADDSGEPDTLIELAWRREYTGLRRRICTAYFAVTPCS